MSATQEQRGCTGRCPCMAYCPLSFAMDRIGGKWKLLILCALYQDGTTRYNELKRKISGITNTMLASSLKELERDQLICRRQYMEMPVRVEYFITEDCTELMPILGQLAAWGIQIHNRNA